MNISVSDVVRGKSNARTSQVQREDAEEDQPEHRVETAGRLGGLGRGGTRK
jgi:hypothetical protein